MEVSMDKQKAKSYTTLAQPLVSPGEDNPYGEVKDLSDTTLAALRLAERMTEFSGVLAKAAEEDEAYETIKRLVERLHRNLEEVSESANRALKECGFYR
jgi:hypothetical protein